MRQLYPKDEKTVIYSKGDKFVLTEADYNSLIDKIQKAQEAIEREADDREDAINEVKTQIAHLFDSELPEILVNQLTAALITSDEVNSQEITADKLTVLIESAFKSLTAEYARIRELTSDVIQTTEITGTNAEFDKIKAETAEISNYDITNLTSTTADVTNITASQADIERANIGSLDSTNISIATAEIRELEANKAEILEANLNKFEYEFATTDRDLFQDIGDDQTGADLEYWIVLPTFLNGTYYLLAEGPTKEKLWSMEIDNSTKNISFAWSISDTAPYLEDIEIIQDSSTQTEFIQIHAHTYGLATRLYHRADSYNTEIAPTIYTVKQYDGTKDFKIQKSKGVWMPNAVFAGEFHADTLEIDNVEFDNITVNKTITLPLIKDQYGDPVTHTTGNVGDYITNTKDEFDNVGVQWQKPADGVYRGDQRLITSDAVSTYDGKVDVTDYNVPDPETVYDYSIVNLGDNTEVHGDIKVDGNTQLKNFYNGPEEDFVPGDYGDNSIIIFTEVDDDSDYIANRVYRYRKNDNLETVLEEIIATSSKEDQKPVVYDQETNSYKTVDGLAIGELNVTELHADKAYIKELDTVKEETVSSTGDYSVLRANNPAALGPDEHSGILIHNYDGRGTDSAVVSDSTGTIRVGTGVPENTTYATLYYDKTTQKYYTDIEDPATEVEPEGALTSWSLKDDTEDYVKYENAVFSVISFDTLQSVLTRDEAVNLRDQGLLKWNKDSVKADTIPLPTKDEQSLIARVSEQEAERDRYFVSDDYDYYDNTGTDKTQEVDQLLANGAVEEAVDTQDEFKVKDGVLYVHEWNDSGIDYYDWTPEDPPDDAISLTAVDIVTYKNRVSYTWKDKQAGVYHFATEADYEEAADDIPVDSLIVIDSESNYNYGDDRNE